MELVGVEDLGLLTDLYELTMGASYLAQGMDDEATFDLFVRNLPEQRQFLVAGGIEDALDALEAVRFDGEAIAYLRSLEMFPEAYLDYLARFRFGGEVWAMAEGEVFFGDEPVLRVTGRRIEAQIVETLLLNIVNYQAMVASKAARVAIACRGRAFVDFSPRRDHGVDAALKAARAAYVGGAASTSNVLAGRLYGIPVSGTMAHSYVLSFAHEREAFLAYARDFPGRATLLIDTFDTLAGARVAAAVARELAQEGLGIRAVRLDSGDIADLAAGVRRILDEAGLEDVEIFASGDLDEYRIAELVARGAPVDGFGVGTRLGTSLDAPALGSVYKLVHDARGPKMKLSTGKVTAPGKKQVYRFERDGRASHDLVALEDERVEGGRPLLSLAMAGGRRVREREPLERARERCAEAVAKLPERLRLLQPGGAPYEVRWSAGLERMARDLRVAITMSD